MFQLSAKNTVNKYTNKLNKISNRPAIAILQAYIFIYSFLNFYSPIKNLHCIYGALTMSISWDLRFMTYTKYTLLSQLASPVLEFLISDRSVLIGNSFGSDILSEKLSCYFFWSPIGHQFTILRVERSGTFICLHRVLRWRNYDNTAPILLLNSTYNPFLAKTQLRNNMAYKRIRIDN